MPQFQVYTWLIAQFEQAQAGQTEFYKIIDAMNSTYYHPNQYYCVVLTYDNAM